MTARDDFPRSSDASGPEVESAEIALTPFLVYRAATACRTKAADVLRVNPDWRQDTQTSAMGHTHSLRSYLAFPDGCNTLYFNESVTELALDLAIEEIASARALLCIGSKIIEQTYYDFHAPTEARVTRNLIVAKKFGTFYTPIEVAEQMATYLLAQKRKNDQLIDPCSGSGMLAGAVLLQQAKGAAGYRRIKLVETDSRALEWSKKLLKATVRRLAQSTDVTLEFECADASEVLAAMVRSRSGDMDIIMNPPYGRLRFTSDTTRNQETKSAALSAEQSVKRLLKEQHAPIKKLFLEFGASSGVPEYSKLFLFLSAQCASYGAVAVSITPNSWMSGADGRALRNEIVGRRLLRTVHLYSENTRLFSTVNQATAITVLDGAEKDCVDIAICGKSTRREIEYATLLTSKDLSLQAGSSVSESSLFARLAAYPKFKQVDALVNVRGEIDQSIFRDSFIIPRTELPLVRGEHVQRFVFAHSSDARKPGYLDPSVRNRVGPKLKFTNSWRIVGRQCSYARQARRLLFAIVPPGVLVGNSCNFLVVRDDSPTEIWAWLGLLNSAVLDWFFSAGNANNHVANYEIDRLPVPHWTPAQKRTVAALAKAISVAKADNPAKALWLEELLEAHVCASFSLSDQDVAMVIHAEQGLDIGRIQHLTRKVAAGATLPDIDDQGFFNHSVPTLSKLDLRMIECVPEGGNWQNISLDIPSARLDQIREMSRVRGVVRTTYYGRLKRDQPSYTISTYFNRPGNGTHIHPIENRTLTSREAARLQTFPDSYVFFGGEGATRDQIGNAVPPLLGRAVGEALLPLTEHRTCVDVFCGAGGLSLGLETAGWRTICAIDNNAAALQTFGFNRPSQFESERLVRELPLILKRDLNNTSNLLSAIEAILDALAGDTLGLLAGGPPCQGFSHAGFRAPSDKRNDLAVAYLRMAAVLRPEVFLLENVEGLLTFDKGRVLEEIIAALLELGYSVSKPVWRLAAESFGVPQMRRRVFIVATKTRLPIVAPQPTHAKCPGRWKTQSGVSDLPNPPTVAHAFESLSMPKLTVGAPLRAWFDSRAT